MQARFFVILFGGLELLFGVTGTAAGVAHFAHLGGMLGVGSQSSTAPGLSFHAGR